jgi:hypothetical protein
MPEDLTKQETSMFPGNYDSLFIKHENQFEPGATDFDGYLQTIAREILGRHISPEKLLDLKNELNSKGYLHMNSGDPAFREAVIKILNKIKLAGKVAHAYRT